jgi:peptidoglycan/LPS O-acetylase OafA/YrhL
LYELLAPQLPGWDVFLLGYPFVVLCYCGAAYCAGRMSRGAVPAPAAAAPLVVEGRMPQLDGIRGLAILVVLIYHYLVCQVQIPPASLLSYFGLPSVVGPSGVDLFFVLSGFLIVGILLDHREADNYFKVFYIRRACRILPLYFLVLLSFYAVSCLVDVHTGALRWLFEDAMPFWSYATFTQNVPMGLRGTFGANWLGATWSLAVEEQFYLVIPLVVYFLSRRAALILFVAAIIAAPVLRYVWPGLHAFINAPFRADTLLMGAVLAIAIRSPAFVGFVRRHPDWLSALIVALLLNLVLITLRPSDYGSITLTGIAALYAIVILMAVAYPESDIARLLRARALVGLGVLSYAVYLFHQPVNGLMHGLVQHADPAIHSVADGLVTAAALVLTIFLAWVSRQVLEVPFLSLGHKARFSSRATGGEHAAPVAPI